MDDPTRRPGPPLHLRPTVRGLDPSATVAINERSDRLRAQGKPVYKLGLGQSPFPVPERVVEALRAHAHEKDYLPVAGLRPLREAVARYTDRATGVSGHRAEQVLVGPGSKELMFLLQLVYDGDLIIPTPAWVSYAPQARIVGLSVHPVPTRREEGWMLTAERFDELCAQGERGPRLVILNYPSNPTGGTFSAGELRQIAEVARRHRVLLLSDEIYGELHHAGRHVSISRYYPEGTIVSSGLSKWCGAGGWRLGTFVFPERLAWLREAMTAAASETYTSTSAPIQHAAITAFEGGEDIERYLASSRRVLGALGQWCRARLASAGVHCPRPAGGFYLFADFEAHREALASRGIGDAGALCERLLEDTGVAILPGGHFGRPARELTARIAYVGFDGRGALEAAARLTGPAKLEATLRERCEGVTRAIDRIGGWLAALTP